MGTLSAGLLLYRTGPGGVEVLLAHPGGPFFAKRDDGWWTLPKGLVEEGEGPLQAARREFTEETGCDVPADAALLDLGSVRQKGGKTVVAWAFAGDWDPARLRCNTFRIEWPPQSGTMREFPELDRAAFFPLDVARRKILPAQAPFLDRLEELVAAGSA
jgi:predicted NUDIX family NTP pyrophosphohydrolase